LPHSGIPWGTSQAFLEKRAFSRRPCRTGKRTLSQDLPQEHPIKTGLDATWEFRCLDLGVRDFQLAFPPLLCYITSRLGDGVPLNNRPGRADDSYRAGICGGGVVGARQRTRCKAGFFVPAPEPGGFRVEGGLLMVRTGLPDEQRDFRAAAVAASLETRLQSADSICQRFHIESLMPQVNACADAMEKGDSVDVAVVGRFNTGKSSFLNSIIGRNLIPVAVLPLTTVVTRLRYGPADRAVVRYQDKTEREIPLDSLAEYVTEQHNPGNAKTVAIVDVETAGLRPYRGICFVDTPGLGSVYIHNTRACTEWLPRVGVALLAVSIDHPLGEDDINLLKELARHTPEVAILVTKADLVGTDEREQVVRFIAQQIQEVNDGNIQIFPFSIRPGFETFRNTMQNYLLGHVSQRHERIAQEIIRYKLRQLTASCREYLQVAVSAAQADEEARAELGKQLERERHDLTTVRNEIWLLSKDFKTRLRTEVLDKYLGHYRDLLAALAADLRPKMKRWRGHLRRTTEQFERWAGEALRAQLEPLSIEEGEELTRRHLNMAQASFSRVVRAFQDRLAKSIEQALRLTFTGAAFEASARQPQRPDVRVGWAFDIPFDQLWFVIPMPVFRPLVNRHFLRLLPWEVEKNLHRLSNQWSVAIGRAIDDLAGQAQRFIREELDTIERLVAAARNQRPEIEEALASLDGVNQTNGGAE